MTVKELIQQLVFADPDALVVLAKDGEGNDSSPLDTLTRQRYRATSTWSGEIEDDDGEQRAGDDDTQAAIVLWPVN